VLLVEVKITLTNVIGRATRTHEHHDLVISLLTFLITFRDVNLLRIIRNNSVWEISTMCVVMVSIWKTRSISRNWLLESISFVVTHRVRIAVVIIYPSRRTPVAICESFFGSTHR
jgi:hypothetical protein